MEAYRSGILESIDILNAVCERYYETDVDVSINQSGLVADELRRRIAEIKEETTVLIEELSIIEKMAIMEAVR